METLPFESVLPEGQDAVLQADYYNGFQSIKCHEGTLGVIHSRIYFCFVPRVSMGKPKSNSAANSFDGSPLKVTIFTVSAQGEAEDVMISCMKSLPEQFSAALEGTHLLMQ